MVQYHRKSLELHWDVLEPLAVQESILVVHHTQQLEYFNTDDYWQRIGYDRVNGNGSKEMGRKKWVESASCAMGRIFTVSELGRMDLGRP